MTRKFDFSGFTEAEIKDASKPSEGGKLLLGGDYIGRIVDVEEVKFANKGPHAEHPALKIQFQITESGTGEGEGQKITDFRVPMFTRFATGKKSPAFKFFQIIKALGLEPGEGFEFPSNEELLGQDIGLKIGYQNPRHGSTYGADERIYNEVTGFYPASDGVSERQIPYPTNISGGGGGGGFGATAAPAASSDTSNPWNL